MYFKASNDTSRTPLETFLKLAFDPLLDFLADT